MSPLGSSAGPQYTNSGGFLNCFCSLGYRETGHVSIFGMGKLDGCAQQIRGGVGGCQGKYLNRR